MSLWRRDGLSEHPHRKELLLAIREHDNGWREADAAPRIDRVSGTPLGFRELASRDRIEIWRRGVRRFGSDQPFAATLILHHAIELHRSREPDEVWAQFRTELDELRQELEAASGVESSEVGRDYRLLQLADTLSLGACGALESPNVLTAPRDYRFQAALGRLRLAPFPLAGSTTLEIAYRCLPERSFDSDADLSVRLAQATWRRLPVRIEPL